ncbi:MAG: ferritin family protein [Pseudomonadota bacterium]
MRNPTLESIIEIAIMNEQEAYDSYMELCKLVDDKTAKDALKFLAEEEKQHKAYLLKYSDGSFRENSLPLNAPINYKIAENMNKPEPRKDISTNDVFLIAANKELNAYNFYKSLADIHPEGDVRDMLLRMAGQELKHKEKVEYLYANTAFPQTAGG